MLSTKYSPNRKYYKINQYINAPMVRLLAEDGKQIGVMPMADARQQSFQTGLDLVLVVEKANPPIVKLISFSKFKYQESKKLQAEKRGQKKGGELKEIQMTPFIGAGDYETRVKKAQNFLTTGNKVKLSIKFQGRQITKKEFGYQLIDKFKLALQEFSTPEGEPKLIGKRLFFTLTPIKGKKQPNSNENNQSQTQN